MITSRSTGPLLLLCVLGNSACSTPACEEEIPSLQLTVELGSEVAPATIGALRVTVSAAGLSKSSNFDPGQLLKNGRASVRVLIGKAGVDGFQADITVVALDAASAVVARADGSFAGSGNACNAFALVLQSEGPAPDAGTHDGASPTPDGGGPVPDGALPTQRFDLPEGTDLVLSTFLAGLSALSSFDRDRPVTLVVPSGSTFGATSVEKAAIASGDLSSYAEVTLEIAGEVFAAAGAANGGAGGHAIVLTSPLRIHITSTGSVRGGGGGGGKGGAGGAGNEAGTWTAWQYSDDTPKTFWSPSWNEIRWNDVGGIAAGAICSACLYAFDSGLVYEKGTLRTVAPLPALHEVRRAPLDTGTPGGGGDGGRGRGYRKAVGDGSPGGAGTHRAGVGGMGGAGGGWGEQGATGARGASGQRYSTTSASEATTGAAGAAGGSPGKAVSATGLTIPFRNDGVVSGALDFDQAAF